MHHVAAHSIIMSMATVDGSEEIAAPFFLASHETTETTCETDLLDSEDSAGFIPTPTHSYYAAHENTEYSIARNRIHHMSVQSKVFCKWCNLQLSNAGFPPSRRILNIETDLADGILLIDLLEAVSGSKFAIPELCKGRERETTTMMRIHQIATVNHALSFLTANIGEPLLNISAEDIVDKNSKLTMGLIWTIIQHWGKKRIVNSMNVTKNTTQLSDSLKLKSMRRSLLDWAKYMLQPYIDIGILVDITDFTLSWQNGKAFLSFVHTFNPELVHDISQFNSSKNLCDNKSQSIQRDEWSKVLDRAFSLAEQHMGIVKLLDIEDLLDSSELDERAIMTYILEFRIILQNHQPYKFNIFPNNNNDGINLLCESLTAQYKLELEKLSNWFHHQQQYLFRLLWNLSSKTGNENLIADNLQDSWSRHITNVLNGDTQSSKNLINAITDTQITIQNDIELINSDLWSDRSTISAKNAVGTYLNKLQLLIRRLNSISDVLSPNEYNCWELCVASAKNHYHLFQNEVASFEKDRKDTLLSLLHDYYQYCKSWELSLVDLKSNLQQNLKKIQNEFQLTVLSLEGQINCRFAVLQNAMKSADISLQSEFVDSELIKTHMFYEFISTYLNDLLRSRIISSQATSSDVFFKPPTSKFFFKCPIFLHHMIQDILFLLQQTLIPQVNNMMDSILKDDDKALIKDLDHFTYLMLESRTIISELKQKPTDGELITCLYSLAKHNLHEIKSCWHELQMSIQKIPDLVILIDTAEPYQDISTFLETTNESYLDWMMDCQLCVKYLTAFPLEIEKGHRVFECELRKQMHILLSWFSDEHLECGFSSDDILSSIDTMECLVESARNICKNCNSWRTQFDSSMVDELSVIVEEGQKYRVMADSVHEVDSITESLSNSACRLKEALKNMNFQLDDLCNELNIICSSIENWAHSLKDWLLFSTKIENEICMIISSMEKVWLKIDSFITTADAIPDEIVQSLVIWNGFKSTLSNRINDSIKSLNMCNMKNFKLLSEKIPASARRDYSDFIQAKLIDEYKFLMSIFDLFEPKYRCADTLASLFIELDQSSDFIDKTFSYVTDLHIPHGFDDCCTEKVLDELEHQLSFHEIAISGWEKSRRMAKINSLLKKMISFDPPHQVMIAVKNRIESTMNDIENIVHKSRKMWEDLSKSKTILKDVTIPGRSIENELNELDYEIGKILSLYSVSDTDPFSGDVEYEVNQQIHVASQLNWALEKLHEFSLKIDSLKKIAQILHDSRVDQFISNLDSKLIYIQQNVQPLVVHALNTTCLVWEKNHVQPSESMLESIELILYQPIPSNQALIEFSNKIMNTEKQLLLFSDSFSLLQTATDRLCYIMKSFHVSSYANDKMPLKILDHINPTSDKLPYLCDSIQSRCNQIAVRYSMLNNLCQSAMSFQRECENILLQLESITQSLSQIGNDMNTVSFKNHSLHECLDGLHQSEKSFDFQWSLILSIENSIHQLESHPLASLLPQVHEVTIKDCFQICQRVAVIAESMNSKLSSQKYTLELLQRYFADSDKVTTDLLNIHTDLLQCENRLNDDAVTISHYLIDDFDLYDSSLASFSRTVQDDINIINNRSTHLENLSTEIQKFISSYKDVFCDKNLTEDIQFQVDRFESGLFKALSSTNEYLKSLSARLNFRNRVFDIVMRHTEIADTYISAHTSRILHGDTGVLMCMTGDIIERLGQFVDGLVTRWEDEVISLEENHDKLILEGETLCKSERVDDENDKILIRLVFWSKDYANRHLSKLQHAFETKKEGLFSLCRSVDQWLLSVNDREASLENTAMILGERLTRKDEKQESGDGYLVITGTDSVDSRNLMLWRQIQAESDVLLEKYKQDINQIEDLMKIIDAKSRDNLGGTGHIMISDAMHLRIQKTRDLFRSISSLGLQEKISLDNASNYKKWHSELNIIDSEVEILSQRLQNNTIIADSDVSKIQDRSVELTKCLDELRTATLKSRTFMSDLHDPSLIEIMSASTYSGLFEHARQANEIHFRTKCDVAFNKLRSLESLLRSCGTQESESFGDSWTQSKMLEIENMVVLLPPQDLISSNLILTNDESPQSLDVCNQIHEAMELFSSISRETEFKCLSSTSTSNEQLEKALQRLGTMIEETKRLYDFDKSASELMMWIHNSTSAIKEFSSRLSATLSQTSTSDNTVTDIMALQDQTSSFELSIVSFMTKSEEFIQQSSPSTQHSSAVVKEAFQSKLCMLKQAWELYQESMKELDQSIRSSAPAHEFWKILHRSRTMIKDAESKYLRCLGSEGENCITLDLLKDIEQEIYTVIQPSIESMKADEMWQTYRYHVHGVEKGMESLLSSLDREIRVRDEEIKNRAIESVMKRLNEFATVIQVVVGKISDGHQNLELVKSDFACRYTMFHDEMQILIEKAKSVHISDAKIQECMDRWKSLEKLKSTIDTEIEKRDQRDEQPHGLITEPHRPASSLSLGRRGSLQHPPTFSLSRRSMSPCFQSSRSVGARTPSLVLPKGPFKIILPSINKYVPNPADPLDVEIARIVNTLPLSIKVTPATDGNGYWFGDLMPIKKFCRMVNNNVMVRVGGGWQELGEFLKEHSNLEASLPNVKSFAPPKNEDEEKEGEDGETGGHIILEAQDGLNPYNLALYRSLQQKRSFST